MSHTFDRLNISKELIDALAGQGITEPTSIQELAIPSFLQKKDIIAESYTGSGKTLAFLLPLFEKIDAERLEMQAIILAPTHELVMQIHNQITLLREKSGIMVTSTPIIGEVHIDKQIKKLKEKPHIIVGSPGRVLDLMDKRKITAHTIQTIILDEADNLLEQNESATITKLIKMTKKDTQLCAFSASITAKTLGLAKRLMKEPEVIKAAPTTVLNPNITHFYTVGSMRDKFDMLRRLINQTTPDKALIFVSQHTDVKTLIEKLTYHHYKVASISGKISKEERKNALTRFRTGKVKLMISSDLSARGLDVPDISHVFHFDAPLTAQDYLHRAGRTARGLHHGTSICILTPKELGSIRIYEKAFHIKFKELKLQGGHAAAQLNATSKESKKAKGNSKKAAAYDAKSVKSKKLEALKTPSKPKTKQKEASAAPRSLFDEALALIANDKFGKNYD